MKKYLLLIPLLVLMGAGCSATSTDTDDLAIGDFPWDGEWSLVSEIVQSPAGEITSPLTNKILIINGEELTEDYSALEGLGSDCSSVGQIESALEIHENVATASGAAVLVEPYISCGPDGIAGTNAVPRSLTEMEWYIENWEDQIIATAIYGPSVVEQVYER
jgi:hypothetical protein